MLFALLLQLYLSFFLFISGIVGYCFTGSARNPSPHPTLIFLCGLIIQILFAQAWSLFFPVNIYTSFGLNSALLILYVAINKKTIPFTASVLKQVVPKSGWLYVCFAINALCLLCISAGPTMMDDTESYHLQTVRWLQEWGTVPGLANLHLRYGFHTSWLNGVAMYSIPNGHNYYTALNCSVSVWLALYLLSPVASPSPDRQQSIFATACGSTLVFSLLLWSLLRKNSSTTNYDFITAACTLVVVAEAVKHHFGQTKNVYSLPPEWLLYPVFLCSVRIMNFPLLLLTACFIYHHHKKASLFQLSSWVLFIIVAAVPFVARNYILSGYPFFPSMVFAFGTPDWRADPALVNDILRFIKYFNRINNTFVDIEETARISFPDWIAKWYQYLFSYDKVIIAASICGTLLFLFTHKIRRHALLLILAATFVCQTLLWFFAAPDPRFIYGVLLSGFFAGIVALAGFMNTNLLQIANTALPILAALVMSIIVFRNWSNDQRYRNAIQPAIMPKPETKVIQLKNQQLIIPATLRGNWNPRCYDLQIPCLYRIDHRLGLRSNSLEDGFYLRPVQTK